MFLGYFSFCRNKIFLDSSQRVKALERKNKDSVKEKKMCLFIFIWIISYFLKCVQEYYNLIIFVYTHMCLCVKCICESMYIYIYRFYRLLVMFKILMYRIIICIIYKVDFVTP